MGRPAVFVRTAGCLAPFCDFCDSKFSWANGKEISIEEIIKKVKEYKNCGFVVITGGEPFIQNETNDLIKKLIFSGYDVQVETSGKVDFARNRATVVCSPKQYDGKFYVTQKAIENSNYFKFIVKEKGNDFVNVLRFIVHNEIDIRKCYLMPLTTGDIEEDKKIQQVVWNIAATSNINYSPRIHNDVWGIKKRGV